jgi:CDP-6-deoxy-D-xylo-4-hexulose-3-dehydrase
MEDCCESLGSKFGGEYAGTFGIASSFSFFFSHHLVTMEGGMILTKDKDFAKRCRLLRAHGWDREVFDPVVSADSDIDSRYKFVAWGFNLRPTELQAGFGIEQIKKIDQFQEFRDQNSAELQGCINRNSKFLSTMQISNDVRCSWFAFPIIVNKKAPFSRKQLANFLDQNGIESRPVVAGNLAKQPATKQFPEITFGALPGADYIHQQGLYIGIHPTTNRNNLKKVVQLLNNYCDQW